jgi:shikimate kinase
VSHMQFVEEHEAEAAAQHVVIIGMMGSGKTTLGLALAERFSMPYFDSDEALTTKMGASGRDLSDRMGVEYLHSCEAEILLDQLAGESPSVISAAASTIDDATCREHLAKGHRVLWLDAPAALLTTRLQFRSNSLESTTHTEDGDAPADVSHRRTLRSEEFESLLVRRRTLFAQSATICLDATLSLDELVALVTVAMAQAPSAIEESSNA